MQTLEVMSVRSELRFWVSGNPEVSMQSEFCSITVKPVYFSPSQVQLHLPRLVPRITPQHFFATCRRLSPHHLLWVNLEWPKGMWDTVSPGWSFRR